MITNVKRRMVRPLCAAAITLLGTVGVPALAQAEDGCIPGYWPRNLRPGDDVCVTTATAVRLVWENSQDFDLHDPNGAYGPLSCKQGYVWRDAFDGDGVCVTPDSRALTHADNAAAPSRRVSNTPPPLQPVPTPPAMPG
jgi:hypothetical protein